MTQFSFAALSPEQKRATAQVLGLLTARMERGLDEIRREPNYVFVVLDEVLTELLLSYR